MTSNEETCVLCRAGLHAQCVQSWTSSEQETLVCCCGGMYTLAGHLREMIGDDYDGESSKRPTKGVVFEGETPTPSAKILGESGYIHPDAWASTRDIGTLTAVSTTGRKRAARMFPIEPGMVCEWARKKNVGYSPRNIIGCMGSPATDIHHGPDKNTLNNSKMSRGVGFGENVHLICSDCHNSIHAANDQFYPEYDRDEQQAEPWLPNVDFVWDPPQPEPAEFNELAAEEQRREKRRKERGRDTRGRNSQPRTAADTTVTDDGDEG